MKSHHTQQQGTDGFKIRNDRNPRSFLWRDVPFVDSARNNLHAHYHDH